MSSTKQPFIPLENVKVTNCRRIKEDESKDMIEPTEIITCWNRNKKSLFYIFIGTIGIIAIICISLNNLLFATTKQSQQIGRKALADAASTGLAQQIPELDYFIVHRPCKDIAQITEDGGIKASGNYYSNKSQYDSNWVYTSPIDLNDITIFRYGQDEAQFGSKMKSGRDCLLRINKEILNNPEIVRKMLINEERDSLAGRGYFTPKQIVVDQINMGSHVSLFFGGDRDVADKMNWSPNTRLDQGRRREVQCPFTAEDKESVLSQPQFNGDTNELIRIIKDCLARSKTCSNKPSDVLFRDMVPYQYISGYYELENDDMPNFITAGFDVNWKPLSEYVDESE